MVHGLHARRDVDEDGRHVPGGKDRAGIIGTGNIGAEMARLCRAVGMNVIAWTFNPSDERAARLGVEFVEFPELLANAPTS